MHNENSEHSPENGGEREARIFEAKQHVREAAIFMEGGPGIFEDGIYQKLKAELEDAIEVFLEEELEVERAYALGLYEQLKKRNAASDTNKDESSRQNIYRRKDFAESRYIRSAVEDIRAINEANFMVLGVMNDMELNKKHFGQLSPTSEEINEWRRKLDFAIMTWNDPQAKKILKELNDTFPNL